MKNDFHYDPVHSIIGSENHFVELEELQLPPPEFNLFYVYACVDAFDAIISQPSRLNLNHLLVLHIKFCHPNDLNTLDSAIKTQRFNINQQYTGFTQNCKETTMLHCAAVNGNEALVKHLIQFGANPSARSINKRTPLHSASFLGHLGVVKVLIDAHADLNAIDSSGWTSILMASRSGRLGVVNALIYAEADLDIADRNGWTPLHAAVQCGHVDIARALIAAHANVNVVDGKGWTPLILAISVGHMDLVHALIAAGADSNMGAIMGRYTLAHAMGIGHTEIINVLMNAGAKANAKDEWTPMHIPLREECSDVTIGLYSHELIDNALPISDEILCSDC